MRRPLPPSPPLLCSSAPLAHKFSLGQPETTVLGVKEPLKRGKCQIGLKEENVFVHHVVLHDTRAGCNPQVQLRN